MSWVVRSRWVVTASRSWSFEWRCMWWTGSIDRVRARRDDQQWVTGSTIPPLTVTVYEDEAEAVAAVLVLEGDTEWSSLFVEPYGER